MLSKCRVNYLECVYNRLGWLRDGLGPFRRRCSRSGEIWQAVGRQLGRWWCRGWLQRPTEVSHRFLFSSSLHSLVPEPGEVFYIAAIFRFTFYKCLISFMHSRFDRCYWYAEFWLCFVIIVQEWACKDWKRDNWNHIRRSGFKSLVLLNRVYILYFLLYNSFFFSYRSDITNYFFWCLCVII